MGSGNEVVADGGTGVSELKLLLWAFLSVIGLAILASVVLGIQKHIGGNMGFAVALFLLLVGGTALNYWIKTKQEELENST